MGKVTINHERALVNSERLLNNLAKGHDEWIQHAERAEGFFLGSNCHGSPGQWDPDDLMTVRDGGRLAEEINLIAPRVRTALAHQIANRMMLHFMPRGGAADAEKAAAMQKIAMYACDRTGYRWHESSMFADGLITGRGFLDIRMSFEENINGHVNIRALAPKTVIPDPRASSHDPDDWADVTVYERIPPDDFAARWGKRAWKEISSSRFATDGYADHRMVTAFARSIVLDGHDIGSAGDDQYTGPYVEVIDRQYWSTVTDDVLVMPTGDLVPSWIVPPDVLDRAVSSGITVIRRKVRRPHWLVTAGPFVLHDAPSPYPWFTVVPYFPVIRQGRTTGMVQDAISPQRLFNKALSSYIHIITAIANSGWVVEQNSLVNMTEEELEDIGARTGLVLVHRPGTNPPARIQPISPSAGMDKVISLAAANIEQTTGINAAMLGEVQGQVTGVATQSLQHAAQMQLTVYLDALARTRTMVGKRLLYLIQRNYVSRDVVICDMDSNGIARSSIANIGPSDFLSAQYDIVITEQPAQVTFQNSQFQQALAMRERGVAVPDHVVIRLSSLENKDEIVESMSAPQEDPVQEAKAALLAAQKLRVEAEATAKRVDTIFAATEAAQNIAAVPEVAPVADSVLRSANYPEPDPATPAQQLATGVPAQAQPPTEPGSGTRENTHPLRPPRPTRGLRGG